MRLNQFLKHFCPSEEFPKHVFWMRQPLLQLSENIVLSVYFLRTEIRRSHSVPNQDYMADDSSNWCFRCSKMQLFGPMCESWCGEVWSVFGNWFSWFFGGQIGNQLIVYHTEFTALRCSSITIATCPFFPKKQANSFGWIWLLLKYPSSSLLFTFGLMRVNPRFITCHDVIDVFRSTAIVFYGHFLRHYFIFWAIDECCGIQWKQIFQTIKSLCIIESGLVPLMPKVVIISP